MKPWKHLDLFSGIGGFALAVDRVWPNAEHIFCDNEPFSQAVLKKHWPKAEIFGDIRTLTYAKGSYDRGIAREIPSTDEPSSEERQEKRTTKPSGSNSKFGADLITGGFLCQPFSNAGKRKGTADDRHLWPEMLRVIREVSPRWVVGENVRGLTNWDGGVVFEQVQSDLEALNFEVISFLLPAVAVNAPHRRDRIWIIGHATGDGRPRRRTETGGTVGEGKQGGMREFTRTDSPHSDSPSARLERTAREKLSGQGDRPAGTGDVANTEISEQKRSRDTRRGRDGFTNESWNQNWLEVATRLCTVDDGLPNGLARPRGWRDAALKGAGNAIVPQVAEQIFKVIKQIDGAE